MAPVRSFSCFTVPFVADMSQSQTDELALLDEDDSMDPDDPEEDETQGMNGDPGGLLPSRIYPRCS